MEPITSLSSSKMGIMCLVCQEYGDHITSKCPNNRCKSCGIKGHVNKDCLTRDLLNISTKYKYSSSEPENIIQPSLGINIQRIPMTYENELEDTIPLLLKPLKRETEGKSNKEEKVENIYQVYSSKNPTITKPEEGDVIFVDDDDGQSDSKLSPSPINKIENVEEMLRLARKALEESDRLNKETEKRARESERIHKETKILKRKMKYEKILKCEQRKRGIMYEIPSKRKKLKPSSNSTSLLIKIKNDSSSKTNETNSTISTTTRKAQKLESTTTEFLREKLKNAYDDDMKIENSSKRKNKLISSNPSRSTSTTKADNRSKKKTEEISNDKRLIEIIDPPPQNIYQDFSVKTHEFIDSDEVHHTCGKQQHYHHDVQHQICPKCIQLKFKGSNQLVSWNFRGNYTYKFDMELSSEVYNLLRHENPVLRLLPTRPTCKDFKLVTKFVKLENTTAVQINFMSNHLKKHNIKLWEIAPLFVAQVSRNFSDKILRDTLEDVMSAKSIFVGKGRIQKVNLRLTHNSRYDIGNEIKITPYAPFIKVLDSCNMLLYDNVNKCVMTWATVENKSDDTEFALNIDSRFGKIVQKLRK